VNVPKWLPWVGLAAVAVAVVAWVFPRLAKAYGVTQALSRCAELERQRAQLAVQGTDPVTLARLDSEIRACSQTAQSLGAEIDLGDVTLEACIAKLEQINQEWAHYRSTEYSDAVKRNNTRSAMLRFGEEAARCASGAVDDAESVAALDRIRSALSKGIGEAEARERCYLSDGTGCGRFGLNEDHGNDKARAERERVIEPLRAAHTKATEKRDALRAGGAGLSTKNAGASPA
jgi:hypothetical protein